MKLCSDLITHVPDEGRGRCWVLAGDMKEGIGRRAFLCRWKGKERIEDKAEGVTVSTAVQRNRGLVSETRDSLKLSG